MNGCTFNQSSTQRNDHLIFLLQRNAKIQRHWVVFFVDMHSLRNIFCRCIHSHQNVPCAFLICHGVTWNLSPTGAAGKKICVFSGLCRRLSQWINFSFFSFLFRDVARNFAATKRYKNKNEFQRARAAFPKRGFNGCIGHWTTTS